MFVKKQLKNGANFALGILLVFLPLVGLSLLADSLNVFSSGETVSSSRINANFTKIVPIGGIVAWHKDLSGVPSLPDGWVECDGSVISDSESTLNGQTAPDLNGDAGTGNGGRFLRGNSALSTGTFQDDAYQGHQHQYTAPVSVSGSGGITTGGADLPFTTRNSGDSVTDGTNGTPRVLQETRPSNMSVIWIMRIK